ncbi:MAG: outer membrane protein transport protein [Melioribacteraceae bacterium]|nr:outer membrane protein transport protein [Melioribacteraceae bacterium]MCF8355504.1 outer membrane protein transport protein [Melioribacteraceae bacterium]MCF8394192.1 outer membrane protein transport protein [Melioribacteraceae bacterium]MCF8419912.1 outer membrane protein transport protein [Melioribacteraceae bacterium]
MKLKIVFVSMMIIGLVSFVNAQNDNDVLRLSEPGIGSSARALGMGNAYVAVSDDYSGAAFNPAGLGLIRKMEMSGGLQYNSLGNESLFFGNTTDYSSSKTGLNQFGFVFPFPTFRGSLVFSLGYNKIKDFNYAQKFDGYNNNSNSMIQYLTGFNDDVPFLLGLSYPVYDNNTGDYLYDNTKINGQLNQSGTILKQGSLNSWSLAGAVEIAPELYVGATLNILSGDYSSNREYYEDDTKDVYPNSMLLDPAEPATAGFNTFYFNDFLEWELSGWDLKVGLLYQLRNNFRFGASIKFPSSITIDELYYVDGYSDFESSGGFELDPQSISSEIEYKVKTPFEFTAGFSANFYSLIVSAQAQLIDYTQMEFTEGLTPTDVSQINKDIKDNYKAAGNYNLGLEYNIPFVNMRVRGGFMYMTSPYKDDPSQFDKKYLTAGIGFLAGRLLAVDIGYAHGWWETFSDNYGFALSRTTEKISLDNFIVTLGYRF